MFGCAAALLEGTARFERVVSRGDASVVAPGSGTGDRQLSGDALSELLELPSWRDVHRAAAVRSFCYGPFAMLTACLGRVLNARGVTHIGVLSYSIYLWQTLFLHHRNGTAVSSPVPPGSASFPFNWIAILFWWQRSPICVVERPSLRLRNRLLRSSGAVYQRASAPTRCSRHRIAQQRLSDSVE